MHPPTRGRRAPLLAALAGGLFALWLYGLRVLDPRSAAWLMHGDPLQHYLGSAFFLAEGWQWPPGLFTRFGEHPASVVFTDSIPVVALLAKALGLAPGLQYFGLWMLACHALNGWFGVRLLQRLGVKGLPAWLGALFFVAFPALLLRAYGHEALMGHFLVLAALERALAPWRWVPWLLITGFGLLVHPYLGLMVAVVGTAAAAAAVAGREVPVPLLLTQSLASVPLLGALVWAAGYFVGNGEVSAAGHGFFSANALAWLDPMNWRAFAETHQVQAPYVREWSRFLPPQPQATLGQYEGFAYLGAGLLFVVICAVLVKRRAAGETAGPVPQRRWRAVWGAALLLALLALSARPSIGGSVVAELPLPALMERALGVFRASGRFIWPATYLLAAWALSRVGRMRGATVLLVLALAVQWADLSGKFKEFRARFRLGPPHIESPVADPVWATLLQRCPRLQVVSEAGTGVGAAGPALAAATAGATLWPGPTGRLSAQTQAQRREETLQLLAGGHWRNDTVYLLAAPLPGGASVDRIEAGLTPAMRLRRIDGHTVLASERCLD